MNIPEYNTELVNSVVLNFANKVQRNNESLFSTYDYLYDNMENNMNNNMSYSGGLQHLSTMFQQLLSKISDNQTTYNISSSSLSSSLSEILFPSSLSSGSSLSSSYNDANSYRLLSIISLWFVLILNPILILFGAIGNLLTIYILINCNIVKLPVSFYTVMLNISDTLNLLIPVFIFWLDNCFNRTPERGYFRDKSNFLCKALMCPDQLFAALSAWYMCAISFNRWYSVCRPLSYFFHMPSHLSKISSGPMKNNINENNRGQKKYPPKSSFSSLSSSSSSPLRRSSIWSSLNCCYCLTRHIKHRQHLQAFRSIAIITLVGILCCLYPIFMHELRPIILTNRHDFDLKQKTNRKYAVIWKRCYYNEKHEYAYDIIGIILSCLLHVLPLTFVAVMNIMIIITLRQRQNLMSISTNTTQSPISIKKTRIPLHYLRKRILYRYSSSSYKQNEQTQDTQDEITKSSSQSPLVRTYKDQATLTDLPIHTVKLEPSQIITTSKSTGQRRHYSRDRTITIMLVSVALTYLILTLPYRLFWSYNVYIKRMHPEKLNSSIYLLKMHYIDHVLRTIRNMHYGTNFIFFILLSKSFRRKFQQLIIENFFPKSNRLYNRNMDTYSNTTYNNTEMNNLQRNFTKLGEKIENNEKQTILNKNNMIGMKYSTNHILQESLDFIDNLSKEQNEIRSIVKCDHDEILHELQ
ncbi:unnamed protein product [Rotaria sordida]|uniref:G-protein coupled receptors family 1 profile domain-containing protein n=1 Tax=Rotaria sordida TaxID=392033 RepID=A0A815JRR6_9BILA|nr:unnamed protein product [Rotaria sordida]